MDMCKGQIDFNIKTKDGFKSEELNGYIKIPQEDISDDYFEIYFEDGIEDCDYHENIDERILKVLYDDNEYNHEFLETVCDYAYASNEHEICFAFDDCYVRLSGDNFEWNVKASDDDKIFVSLNIMTMDSRMGTKHSSLPKLLSKEEKLLEISKLSEKVASMIYSNVYNVGNFADHMYDSYTVDFISDDDINRFSYENIFKELGTWCELEHEHNNLNDLKIDVADIFNIDNYAEQNLEELILSCFDNNEVDKEYNCISDEINNIEISFDKAIDIMSEIIKFEYFKEV